MSREVDLDEGLRKFNHMMKKRNDPLIMQSKKILWLAQGEFLWKRAVRWIAFVALEWGELAAGDRRRLEKDAVPAKYE